MPNATYFVQECPTCGRRLQIRVENLGKKVVCQHCQGKFLAMDSASARSSRVDPGNALLERANMLLVSAGQHGGRSRPTVKQ